MQCLFLVLYYNPTFIYMNPDTIKAPLQIGNNQETINAKGSYPHVTIGLAVVMANRMIVKNRKRRCEAK